MIIRIVDGLPYITAVLTYHGESLTLEKVLLDTGSAGTLFSLDLLTPMGIRPEPEDLIYRISGIGGSEFVFGKELDSLVIGELIVTNFTIEVGAMNYGIEIDGIIGINFLLQTKAIIDLSQLELYSFGQYNM